MAGISWVKFALSCPAKTSTLLYMINQTTIEYAAEIVKNLEKRGESMSFIIGFLQATISGMSKLTEIGEVEEYLKRSIKHSA